MLSREQEKKWAGRGTQSMSPVFAAVRVLGTFTCVCVPSSRGMGDLYFPTPRSQASSTCALPLAKEKHAEVSFVSEELEKLERSSSLLFHLAVDI